MFVILYYVLGKLGLECFLEFKNVFITLSNLFDLYDAAVPNYFNSCIDAP